MVTDVSFKLTFWCFRPQKIAWHGGDTKGSIMEDSYCQAWTTAAEDRLGMGSSLINGKLLDMEEYSCHSHFVLLCIEITSYYDLKK